METRELLVAVFNLLGDLARRTTGEIPILCVREADGSFSHIYPQTEYVSWLREEASGSLGLAQEFSAMRCSVHGVQYATQPESQQVSER